MAKSQRPSRQKNNDQAVLAVDSNAFDPALSSLFASSLGPVERPSKSRYRPALEQRARQASDSGSEGETASSDEPGANASSDESGDEETEGHVSNARSDVSDDEESASEPSESDDEAALARLRESVMSGAQDRSHKKRKRGHPEEELEDAYMRKLAQEEVKEEEKRKKKQKAEAVQTAEEDEGGAMQGAQDSDDESFTIPRHETLEETKETPDGIEKASRTVFLGNVSSQAIASKSDKKTLMRHLGSFIPDLADRTSPHKVESIRFRSTAFASALPKKAAFAKKEIMEATTKSTNAYAVYSTQLAAREAVKRLNGSVVLGRHLRVDSVAHPARVDHRRCVFIGNLGFVDDESKLNADEEGSKKKNKPPGDVEEGLWVQFSKAGKVESVRVVRDSKTRVGKGFAYVQFEDENGVEAALQFNDQKFPPLLPRKLRVVRAKGMKPNSKKPSSAKPTPNTSKSKGVYNAKVTDEQKTMQGRARAMLGKAGAFKSAESFVFEGHRASSKQGTSGLKLGGKKKKGGKLSNRSSKRAAAWKAAGGKKPSK